MLRWTRGLSRLTFTEKIRGSNPLRSTRNSRIANFNAPFDKRLSHRPFKVKSRVRIPYGSQNGVLYKWLK